MTDLADPENIVELFESSVARNAPRELFGTKTDQGWLWLTYADVARMVDAMRAALSSLGIGRGDRVAIIANNRVEWAVASYATYGLGAAFVPMYENQSEKDWAFILKDCGAKGVFVPNEAVRDRIAAMADTLPALAWTAVLDGMPGAPSADGERPRREWYSRMLVRHAADTVASLRPSPDETACIIYTSGTTGEPKGVVLSHGNMATNVAGIRSLGMITEDDRSLSFLPWAHAMGNTCELNGFVSMGASIGICEGIEHIISNLAEVRPTVLLTVPRIFNKIYNGVRAQIASKPAPVQKLVNAGLAAAKRKRETGSAGFGGAIALSLADKLVFSKVRARFGGRLRLAVSGAAALAVEVAEFIDAIGIQVYEGYGLSEASPIVTVNYPGNRKIGSVGKAIPGVHVGITAPNDAGQGEIVVRGPNVMRGYYGRPKETAEVITPDGALRTGDLGRIDEDGYLFITGRIKEQYKLENGKYVVPGPLEERLKLSPLVANAFVYGDNRPYNVALIVANIDAVKAALYGDQPVIPAHAPETLLADQRVVALLSTEIDRLCADIKGYERIRKIALIAEDFTQENGMLTPTLKLKRRNVMAKWGSLIETLYA